MWISEKAVSETWATWRITQTAAVAWLCLVSGRSPRTSALLQDPSSGAEIPRASPYLCCHPVFCALVTRALKQGLPLAPPLVLVSQMLPAMRTGTQPNISPDICKYLENPWATVWAIRNWDRAQSSVGSMRRTLLLLGYVDSLLSVRGTKVCWK